MHTIIIALHGQEIIVDEKEFERLSQKRWHLSSKGYPTCSVKRASGKFGTERMHRMLMGLGPGDPRQVDHINMNKLDNRKANLRICSRSENQMNRNSPNLGANPYKGVTRARSGRWLAQIHAEGKHYNLGTFDSPEEARQAYVRAAEELHGEFKNTGT